MSDSFEVDGNRLTLLHNGAEYFPQLCADMDSASDYIYLESYIFAADEIGLRVSQAMQRAARRGVAVRLLIDGYGSANLPESWLDELTRAGVQVHVFRRELYRFRLRRHRLRRLHRKLAAIDGKIAYVGGINIISDATGGRGAPRFDFAVRVQGEVASDIHTVMRRQWIAVSWARGQRLERSIVRKHAAGTKVTVLLRDNLRHRREIERSYLKAISSAKHEVLIANAYFLPGRIFRRALVQAAKRGVRVVLLLQGCVEHRLPHYATHALYPQLLQAGIEIYEYRAGFLHAKVAVVDECWSTVGSSNIDPLSLLLAREANLVISDADFSAALRGDLYAAISRHAHRIKAGRDYSWWERLLFRASYSLVRMGIGILGYGKRSV